MVVPGIKTTGFLSALVSLLIALIQLIFKSNKLKATRSVMDKVIVNNISIGYFCLIDLVLVNANLTKINQKIKFFITKFGFEHSILINIIFYVQQRELIK